MVKIRQKTALMFLTIVLTATFGTGLLILWRSQLIVESEALQKLQYQTRLLTHTFDQERLKLEYYTDSIESFILSIYPKEGLNEHNIDSFKEQTLSYLYSMADTLKPFSLWLVLAPEIETDWHNLALYDQNDDGKYTIAPRYNLHDMDLNSAEMEWFKLAVEDGEVWTQPYYWENWDMDVISYSRALKSNGKLIGCIGSDFNFSRKKQEWSNTTVYQNGYIYVFNKALEFIYHPTFTGRKLDDMLEEPKIQKAIIEVIDEEVGSLEYTFRGESRITSFATLSNGWKLFVTAPKKEILSGFRKMQIEWLGIVLFVTILSIVISTRFSLSITAPIYTLVSRFAEARKGNFQTKNEIKTNDELQMLEQQYNYLLSELESMIEQLRKKESELILEKERAEHSDRLKTSFLANLSHEIRTPLNGIKGHSKFLLDPDCSEEERNEFSHIIDSNVSRLLRYFDDTMLFAQIEQKLMKPKAQEYPINYLQDDLSIVFQQIANHYKKKTLQTRINSEGNHAENHILLIDPHLLRKIIYILVENAFKFTETGEVEISFHTRANAWSITIRDTGIGIPTESQNRVFEKFFKDESHKSILFEGLGLGLAIAKELTELLGGKIDFKSQLGKGTVFFVTFHTDAKNRDKSATLQSL